MIIATSILVTRNLKGERDTRNSDENVRITTLRTGDHRAALIWSFLNSTVLSDRLAKWTYLKWRYIIDWDKDISSMHFTAETLYFWTGLSSFFHGYNTKKYQLTNHSINRFRKTVSYLQVAHEHGVMASTVEARFIGDNPVPLVVVLELVVATLGEKEDAHCIIYCVPCQIAPTGIRK